MSKYVTELPWEGQVGGTAAEGGACASSKAVVPKISLDYFFLGADQVRIITRNSADKMSTKQLRRNLKTAKCPANGTREELARRYDRLVRDTLAEERMSPPRR